MEDERITLDRAVMITRIAFLQKSIRNNDLFSVLEVALQTIEDLRKRVAELENKP